MFLIEQLFSTNVTLPWYANILNYLIINILPPNFCMVQKDNIKSNAKYYVWDNLYLWKHCVDQVIRMCVPVNKIIFILIFYHSSYTCGGHFEIRRAVKKVLECGLYWSSLFWNLYSFFKSRNHYQKTDNISQMNEIQQTPILLCKIFYVWRIDFKELLPISFDYV